MIAPAATEGKRVFACPLPLPCQQLICRGGPQEFISSSPPLCSVYDAAGPCRSVGSGGRRRWPQLAWRRPDRPSPNSSPPSHGEFRYSLFGHFMAFLQLYLSPSIESCTTAGNSSGSRRRTRKGKLIEGVVEGADKVVATADTLGPRKAVLSEFFATHPSGPRATAFGGRDTFYPLNSSGINILSNQTPRFRSRTNSGCLRAALHHSPNHHPTKQSIRACCIGRPQVNWLQPPASSGERTQSSGAQSEPALSRQMQMGRRRSGPSQGRDGRPGQM